MIAELDVRAAACQRSRFGHDWWSTSSDGRQGVHAATVKRSALVAVAPVAALLVACGGSSEGCTEIGGTNGLTVTIPAALYVQDGSVSIEVCDDAKCGAMTEEFGELPGDASAEERVFVATFRKLGQEFQSGLVTVRVDLRDVDGTTLALRADRVQLSRRYPNGERCDDGFVTGSLQLQPRNTL